MGKNASTPLLAAYLIVGADELKRETALKRLQARVAAEGDISFNLDTFNGESASGADIVAACNTLPFASPLRLVKVAHVEKLKKADSQALVAYLDAPLDTTVLALSAEKLAKNTSLYKACSALGKQAIIDCAPKKRYEMPRLVKTMAKSHGVTLSDRGALALIEMVGENTVLLDSELKKLALSCGHAGVLDETDVKALVVRTAEVKPWEFVDAFAARNLSECVRLWNSMQDRNDYYLFSLCVERIRELIAAQALDARGESTQLASVLGVPSWRVKNHLANSRRFSLGELESALICAVDTEHAMKSGTDHESAFFDWVVSVLSK